MTGVALAISIFLLANFAVGWLRALRGPSEADTLIVAQLVGTTGVGILLLLAYALGSPALYDAALLFVLLALVTVAAFARRIKEKREGEG